MDGSRDTQLERTQSPDPSRHTPNAYDAVATESDWLDEVDDDDMDFEPDAEESEDVEFFDPSEEEDDVDFHDADEGLSAVEVEVAADEDETTSGLFNQANVGSDPQLGRGQAANAARPGGGTLHVTRNQIMALLGHAGLGSIFVNHGDSRSADDDDDDYYESGRRRPKPSKHPLPKVPSEEGTRLMRSGTFGCTDPYQDELRRRNKRLARKLLSRELGAERDHSGPEGKSIFQGMIPSSKADTIIHYNDRCYSGQFSDDGNFFFSCAKDFKVRMYDTSNPYRWRYYKTVTYPFGQWTITDASLSPDNKYLAYSSIRSMVCLAPTDPNETAEPWLLDFSDLPPGAGMRRYRGGYGRSFGIWSIRFSGDGREIVAGTGANSVLVYDIETRQTILSIEGHSDDVNAVCFGDTSSPHILYSGSDDTLIKVWDRRSMGDSREAGVFMGHTEGLTYVDSKGDGRYVLSNGKDQTMKLWDLRKMMSTEESSKIDYRRYTRGFDYRFMNYSEVGYEPHPYDCSLVTYRGHSVLKTLIRCHFSPPNSTNSRYVYSGSEDGTVHIYNLDATLAGKINVTDATRNSRPRDPDMYSPDYDFDTRSNGAWKTCVRDVSWHPNAPIIAATSWNGWNMATGTCTVHSWNDDASDDEGDPKMGRRVNAVLEECEDLNDTRPRSQYLMSRIRSRRVPVGVLDGHGEGW